MLGVLWLVGVEALADNAAGLLHSYQQHVPSF
jgi:hypothetical protein